MTKRNTRGYQQKLNDDVEQQMKEFVAQLKKESRSTSERIRQLIPLIDEARRLGAKWAEIAERFGIPTTALTAAYRRARLARAAGKPTQISRGNSAKTIEEENPAAAPKAKAKKGVERWP